MPANTAWLFNLGAALYDWFTANRSWRESCARLAARLPAQPGLRVADLGCGPGVSSIAIKRARPDSHTVGVDLARRMLTHARRRLRQHGVHGVLLVQAEAGALPFGSASLDAVTGHSFLYLLPDRRAALAEIERVLRPGGRLVLMEPSARPARVGDVVGVSLDPRHLVSMVLWRPFSRLHGRFSPESLCSLLEQNGLVECQVEQVLGGLGLLASAEKPTK